MIDQSVFESELRKLGIDPAPLGALVRDQKDQSHFVVAGPGTGKTTALAVRAVKLVLVDDVDPGSIVATTFTRRAAGELRSRILQRADQLRKSLIGQAGIPSTALDKIDFNRIRTGTLDSLSQEILTDFRALGSYPPVLIDKFLADAVMLREGLFAEGRFRRPEIIDFIKSVDGTAWGLSPKTLASFVREVHERAAYDQADLGGYRNSPPHPGVPFIVDAIEDYRAYLNRNGQYDYALLETRFLEQLNNGQLDNFTKSVEVLLVDEYQDTNFLQELIYFSLGRAAISRGGGVSVVGDDDQALYRFRGATTSLFSEFPKRFHSSLGATATAVFLNENRRSTDEIIRHVNGYVTLDPAYASMRIFNKPTLVRSRASPFSCPILGMFRDDVQTLAKDLAAFVSSVANGPGFAVPGSSLTIRCSAVGGSPADIMVLMASPAETNAGGDALLPAFLREELEQLPTPIRVYNPRGRAITTVPRVSELLGVVLECVDPSGSGPTLIPNLPQEAIGEFALWRQAASGLISSNPAPQAPLSLHDFVQSWAARTPYMGGGRLSKKGWPREASVLDLIYKCITWMPFFQTDLEGLAYLEAINRTVTAAASIGSLDANLLSGPRANQHEEEKSLRELYWNLFVPLALDFIEVDEDLLETLPSDRLGIFSIHQAKGLEFPLVVVDVGSSFKRIHRAHSFKRFPQDEGRASRIEDQLRKHSALGVPTRTGIDRCFDDLVRQYFVSYSRPQDVLLLVGLNTMIATKGAVPHVATGWNRAGGWSWPGLGHIVRI